jgi:hypothetical protein
MEELRKKSIKKVKLPIKLLKGASVKLSAEFGIGTTTTDSCIYNPHTAIRSTQLG